MTSAATPAPAPVRTSGPVGESDKGFVATWLLCFFLGQLGADRFYLGKTETALLKLVTLGGLGWWTLYDLVLILRGKQTDAAGRPLAGYRKHRRVAIVLTSLVYVYAVVFLGWQLVAALTGPPATPGLGY